MKVYRDDTLSLDKIDFTKSDFNRVRHLIYSYSGIYLHEGKEALVRARLMKRMRKFETNNFRKYLDFVEDNTGGPEFLSFVDVLTTNKTSFFRENQHFDFLREAVIPGLGRRNVKWWSAGCSSGEEPITLAITYLEEFQAVKNHSLKILATDLSRDVLQTAKSGIYSSERMSEVPQPVLRKYFEKIPSHDSAFKVKDQIMNLITYGRLNLMEPWPMKGPFQMIMCRNVLIYFNRQTQQELICRFCDMLEEGGYLFLGHSESVAGQHKGFINVRPSVYQKKGG